MMNFTFDDLADFSQREEQYLQDTFKNVHMAHMEEATIQPGARCINNILAYSKALSVRKSKNLHKIDIVLN